MHALMVFSLPAHREKKMSNFRWKKAKNVEKKREKNCMKRNGIIIQLAPTEHPTTLLQHSAVLCIKHSFVSNVFKLHGTFYMSGFISNERWC
jgi:hypothetical protein